MYTLAQWKNVRRVDHLTLPGYSFRRGLYWAHPRYRDPANRPDLKWLDTWVTQFNGANNDFDRMKILANIIGATVPFVAARAPGDRYGLAANALHNQAILDMNAISGVAHQQGMEDWINNIARPARTIDINPIILTPVGGAVPGATAAKVGNDIANANACLGYQQASLTLNNIVAAGHIHATQHAGQSILLTNPPAPVAVAGKINPDSHLSGGRLIHYCNALAVPPNTVHVVYVPDFELPGVSGRTFRAGVSYCPGGPVTPTCPIVMINATPPAAAAITSPTTLAHEVGHAICRCGDHDSDASALMADGNNRNGVNALSVGARAWMATNDFAY